MRRLGFSLTALAVMAALLLPTAAGAKPPSLASTAQYKAFVEYVKKLDRLVGQPTTAAQKDTYQAELTAKKEAAAHKANALFNRASEEAEAGFDAKAKEQTEAVRGNEEEDLEALHAEFAAKEERAGASYHAKLDRLASGHRKFEAKVNEQIAALRAQKAATPDPAQKEAIQARISAKIEELKAKHEEEKDKRAQLKAGFRQQKEELHAAEGRQETEIGEAAEAKVEKIAKHWQKAFDEKKAKLNSKRESQLAYLEAKLEKGRADVASMPAVG
ncbi:MAG TPA: hypothetical protein VEB65_01995 [Solirubrobacterales bacterium]|nr:hypothetical protein [Solirubrobacterales bacterium]